MLKTLKKSVRFFFPGIMLFLPVLAWADDSSSENSNGPLKILFIGNSYTYANDMPQILKGLASSQGKSLDLVMHAPGGCTMEKHWQDGKAAELIGSKKWDYVVLQENSMIPIEKPKSMKEYFQKFDELIKNQGSKTVLYQTWARQDKSATQRTISLKYAESAKELGATVAPVGDAWQKARTASKPFVLHISDKSHPNESGSYLAACVFYATVLDRKFENLPGRLVFNGKTLTNLTSADANRLQRIARDAVREERLKQEPKEKSK